MCWQLFSAVCFCTAKTIADLHTGTRPMGLIFAAVGGTRIEAWMSPPALKVCTDAGHVVSSRKKKGKKEKEKEKEKYEKGNRESENRRHLSSFRKKKEGGKDRSLGKGKGKCVSAKSFVKNSRSKAF